MKKTLQFLAAAAVLTGMAISCADLDDIRNRMDELDGRITALETITTNLNGNIEAMQALYQGSTINSVTESDGVWTIVLSNGDELTLTQGSIGVGNPPVMSVDKDGYWMVSYDGGTTASRINGTDDQPVKATGTDGKTPQIGVDADGYWTVSYDGDTTPSRIKGTNDQPVKAIPDGGIQDPYFADVRLDGGQFKVTLRSGEELVVPVISDFLCSIEADGMQQFSSAQSKTYTVNIKGVKSTIITAPAGWTAVLSEPVQEKAILTVTAPTLVKSAIADSRSDVSILAFSDQNLATIAKLSVSLSDAPVVMNPTASVTAGEATASTLTFGIAVSDVTSWKYILAKESEAAPSAAKIAAEGTEGTGTSLTLEGLEASTSYVLYVLPVNGEKQGAVASGKNTTTEKAYSNLYDKYMDGMDITIGGKTINKSTYGDAVLINNDSADKVIAQTGVYFVTSDAEGVTVGDAKQLVIISYDEKPATVSKSGQFVVKTESTEDNYLIMQNIKYLTGMTTGNMLGGSKVENVFETILFERCKFDIPKEMNFMYAQLPIKEFLMIDCDIKVHASTTAKAILQTNTTSTYDSVIFRNNIFYCSDGNAVYMMFSNANATVSSVEFNRNTLASVYPKGGSNGNYVTAKLFTSGQAQNNMFYVPDYTTMTGDKYSAILESPNTAGQDLTIQLNLIQYGEAIPTKKMKPHFNLANSDKITAPFAKKTADGDPFAIKDFNNGIFTPIESYASYGAQR